MLSKSIVKDCDVIFNSLTVPDEGYLLTVDYENQYLINSIIVSAGNIKKMVQPTTSRYKHETKKQHKYRIGRGDYLFDLLNLTGKETILNTKVRNSIEHFDEKIDSLVSKKENNNEKLLNHRSLLYNMSLSSRAVFSPEPYYLKAYIVKEKTAFIDNKPINLEIIKKESLEIIDRISELFNEEPSGGSIMKL